MYRLLIEVILDIMLEKIQDLILIILLAWVMCRLPSSVILVREWGDNIYRGSPVWLVRVDLGDTWIRLITKKKFIWRVF